MIYDHERVSENWFKRYSFFNLVHAQDSFSFEILCSELVSAAVMAFLATSHHALFSSNIEIRRCNSGNPLGPCLGKLKTDDNFYFQCRLNVLVGQEESGKFSFTANEKVHPSFRGSTASSGCYPPE